MYPMEEHYKKRVLLGWEHESKEANLAERSEQRDKQEEVREVWGEGRDGKEVIPMQRLAFYVTAGFCFYSSERGAFRGF